MFVISPGPTIWPTEDAQQVIARVFERWSYAELFLEESPIKLIVVRVGGVVTANISLFVLSDRVTKIEANSTNLSETEPEHQMETRDGIIKLDERIDQNFCYIRNQLDRIAEERSASK